MVLLKTHMSDGFEYTTVLVHQNLPMVFLGTSDGRVEVWDLEKSEIIATIQHMNVDEYGDPFPIKEPVVTLAAPYNFEVVYAFFGTAAYCIDVDILTIIQEVPITETVISGSIGQYTGEIGVITKSGYLSKWSPKFVERIASVDFSLSHQECYLLHDYDESKLIIIFPNDNLLLVNLEGDPYTVDLKLLGSGGLINAIYYDKNENFQVIYDKKGFEIHDASSKILDNNELLNNGKISAENKVRAFVSNENTSEPVRNYIVDFRLLRQSRDRYVAEVEKLTDNVTNVSSSISDDSRTINFALNEINSSNLEKKTTAFEVIGKLSKKYNIDPRYIFYAGRRSDQPTSIIERARYFEFEAYNRQKKINFVLILSIPLILTLLLLSNLFIFNQNSLIIFSIPAILQIGVVLYWKNINVNPPIPGIQSFNAVRVLFILSIIFSIIALIYNSFRFLIPI